MVVDLPGAAKMAEAMVREKAGWQKGRQECRPSWCRRSAGPEQFAITLPRKPDKSPGMPPGTCANRCAWLPPRLMFQPLPLPSPFVPAGLVALSLVPANSRLFLRLTTTTFAWDAKPGNFVHLTLME
jgi:hypothetical protein